MAAIDPKLEILKNPPQKQVMLLSCMDIRLLDNTVAFMDGLNLQNRYDHFILAGAAMGAQNGSSSAKCKDGKHECVGHVGWSQVFFDHLTTAIDVLHRKIKDIFILEHFDCGAYKIEGFYPNAKQYKTDMDPKSYNESGVIQAHTHEASAFKSEVETFCKAKNREAKIKFNNSIQTLGQNLSASIRDLLEEERDRWDGIRVHTFIIDLVGRVREL